MYDNNPYDRPLCHANIPDGTECWDAEADRNRDCRNCGCLVADHESDHPHACNGCPNKCSFVLYNDRQLPYVYQEEL